MAIATYRDVLVLAEQLSPTEQRRLVEDLAASVRCRALGGKTRSIMELQWLGKEIWDGIDAQEYVNQERDAWGGLEDRRC
jgi:hypothetical protein